MNGQGIAALLSEHERAQREHASDWLTPARESATAAVRSAGLPTTRDENWKYTDLRALEKHSFALAEPSGAALPEALLQAARFADLDCHELMFVDGWHIPSAAPDRELPAGVRCGSLARAIADGSDAVRMHLTKHAEADTFTALNTSFMRDGAVIVVPDNTVVEHPIHLIYLHSRRSEAYASYPRTLIVAGANAELAVIETYLGAEDADYLSVPVTEVALATGARLRHYRLQLESKAAFHIGRLIVDQERNSRFASHSVSLGGALARLDLHARLSGEGAEATLNGLYLASGRQHVDNHTRVDHLRPSTRSVENYRGVLNEKARAVFNGKVVVHKDAQKTDASQSNANLLLSNEAEVDTKPELEIYADDVKCSHGATVGQLDPDMLFYLRSRAIPEALARRLLTFAFADHVIRDIDIRPIRRKLEYAIVGSLPDADLIREFVA